MSVSTATLAPLTTPWAADSVGCPDPVPSQEGGAFSHVVLRAPTTAGMQTFTIMWNRAVDPMGSNDGNATGRTATTVSFSYARRGEHRADLDRPRLVHGRS